MSPPSRDALLRQRATPGGPGNGYEALGKPVPDERKTAALHALREMNPKLDTEACMGIIGKMVDAIVRDEPYEAMQVAREWGYSKASVLDETGVLRLFATLVTDPPRKRSGARLAPVESRDPHEANLW